MSTLSMYVQSGTHRHFHWRIIAVLTQHNDVIKWKHFPRYWPFVRGTHRSPVNFPYKCQWRGALMFSLICVWINGWVNNREAGDLRRHRAHYDAIVTKSYCSDVCEYDRRPQALTEICSNIGICCGFRAAAARGKYLGFMQLHRGSAQHNNVTQTYSESLWGESTCHRWIPLTKASDVELCFLWSAPGQTVEQTIVTPVIWDGIALIMISL